MLLTNTLQPFHIKIIIQFWSIFFWMFHCRISNFTYRMFKGLRGQWESSLCSWFRFILLYWWFALVPSFAPYVAIALSTCWWDPRRYRPHWDEYRGSKGIKQCIQLSKSWKAVIWGLIAMLISFFWLFCVVYSSFGISYKSNLCVYVVIRKHICAVTRHLSIMVHRYRECLFHVCILTIEIMASLTMRQGSCLTSSSQLHAHHPQPTFNLCHCSPSRVCLISWGNFYSIYSCLTEKVKQIPLAKILCIPTLLLLFLSIK